VLCAVVGVPLNLALLGLYCWYRSMGPRRFAASLAASAAALAVVVTLALLHYQRIVRGGGAHWVLAA
jgi:preprotein translocase subunit SecD